MSTHTFSNLDFWEARADLCMAKLDLGCLEEEYLGADIDAERVRRTVAMSKAMRHLVTVKQQRRRYAMGVQRKRRKARREAAEAAHVPYMPVVATFNKVAMEWAGQQQERTATPAGGTAKEVSCFKGEAFKALPKGLQGMVISLECDEKMDEESSGATADTLPYP